MSRYVLLSSCSLVLFLCGDTLRAQDSSKVINLMGSFGVSQSTVQRTVDVARADFTRSGMSACFRALWRPGHLLGIGVEVASTNISHMMVKQDSALGAGTEMNLRALPVMAVFAMQWHALEASASIGAASYRFGGSADGTITQSDEWEIAWSAGLRYFVPLRSSLDVGVGARVLVIPERRVNAFTGDICMQWHWQYAR